jgi:hypothetical protein
MMCLFADLSLYCGVHRRMFGLNPQVHTKLIARPDLRQLSAPMIEPLRSVIAIAAATP